MSEKKEKGKIRIWLEFLNGLCLAEPTRKLTLSFLRFVLEALITGKAEFVTSVDFYQYGHVANSTRIEVIQSTVQTHCPALNNVVIELAERYQRYSNNLKTAIVVVAGYLYYEYHPADQETVDFHDFIEGVNPEDFEVEGGADEDREFE